MTHQTALHWDDLESIDIITDQVRNEFFVFRLENSIVCS